MQLCSTTNIHQTSEHEAGQQIAVKQLCLQSSGCGSWLPWPLMFHNRVQNGQKLSHACNQGDLERFPVFLKPIIEFLDHFVALNCSNGAHV